MRVCLSRVTKKDVADALLKLDKSIQIVQSGKSDYIIIPDNATNPTKTALKTNGTVMQYSAFLAALVNGTLSAHTKKASLSEEKKKSIGNKKPPTAKKVPTKSIVVAKKVTITEKPEAQKKLVVKKHTTATKPKHTPEPQSEYESESESESSLSDSSSSESSSSESSDESSTEEESKPNKVKKEEAEEEEGSSSEDEPVIEQKITKEQDVGKPLAFIVNPNGTSGDSKPLAILAVLAAEVASQPVTLVYPPSHAQALQFVPKYVVKLLGSSRKSRLHIKVVTDYSKFESTELKNFYSFSAGLAGSPNIDSDVSLDFGDNIGQNRFTTRLLEESGFRVFGPVYLSMGSVSRVIFSKDQSAFGRLAAFRDMNRHRKIIAFAGSLVPPFYLIDILNATHPSKSKWAFVFVNYKLPSHASQQAKLAEFVKKGIILMIESYVEFEDVLPHVDFFVSNCGAGSVTAALAAGVPQMCRATGDEFDVDGGDKDSNNEVVWKTLKLGPNPQPNRSNLEQERIHFTDLIDDLKAHYDKYKKNAVVVAKKVQLEHIQMKANMQAYFKFISLKNNQLKSSPRVPPEFALVR